MTLKNTNQYYTQEYGNCFSDTIGGSGIETSAFETLMGKLKQGQEKLKKDKADGARYLNITGETDDITQLKEIAEKYREFDDVIVFGTGGSSLGAEALNQISKITKGMGYPNLHVITNIAPYTYEKVFSRINFKNAGCIVISKSGGTVETIMQFLSIIPNFRKAIGDEKLKDVITIICEAGDNPLRKLANTHNINVIDHDTNIGGRYSVFSVVGLLPAMLVGLSAEQFRRGANDVLNDALNSDIKDVAPAIGSAIQVGLMDKDINNSVLLAYSDRLGSLTRWYRQLWAESLGKNGKGSSPTYAIGPVDQHSQLQLWLDGPKDKFFTVLRTEQDVKTVNITDEYLDCMDMEYIRGRSLIDLTDASCMATYQSLYESGCPTRLISMQDTDVANMGALMMHYILETVFSAYLLDVNPFDQPAVEKGKKITRSLLENM
ncbi:MAG: glucose-6-phosphate isomerase [Alphaproteobacteria bacterium]